MQTTNVRAEAAVMKAVELQSFSGFGGMRLVEAPMPAPGPGQVLIQVMAAGINFAELELTTGQYPAMRELPFVMGFEAAGVVVAAGSGVTSARVGDRVTSIVASGGFAEFAVADASMCIPIPAGVTFAEATTIPIQGVSALALLKLAARPTTQESVLIQAAAGGVGLYLVQLAKWMGMRQVIALASSHDKLALLRSLGADAVVDYSREDWAEQVRAATGGRGVDVVLEAASGEVGRKSFSLLAPGGRMVVYGARNIHDTWRPEQLRQLIMNNQTVVGFNIPTVSPDRIAPLIPELLELIGEGRLRLFAANAFPLDEFQAAFEALASRSTIGRVVLVPN